jgi:peroxiredoxin (alkyl hydroperoxide reductase subunit C)
MSAIVGKPAPSFEMDVYFPDGGEVKKIRLEDFKGKWLILCFYPADFTFVCPTELKDLAKRYDTIKQIGGEVLAVSTDTVYTHKAWLDSERLLKNVKYPLAADHNGTVTKDYGVYVDGLGVAQRGAFIIDPDGVLRTIYTVDEPIGRSSAELVRLLKALKFVRENPGLACPASWEEGGAVLEPSIKIVGRVYEALGE